MNFRRRLPEIRCLSQGLPRGIGSPFVVSPKRLSALMRGPSDIELTFVRQQ